MYYTYVLYSQKHDKTYIGYTSDIKKRLARHNSLNNKGYTKKYQPWEVLFIEEFDERTEATKKEKYWKSHVGRDKIKRIVAQKYKR
jgi:putative endonuclease